MRLVIALIAAVVFAISPVNKAEAKRATPLWTRWEHFMEESAWNQMCLEAEEEEPDPQDVEYLAIVIFCEVGADAQSDETRYMVGDVVLNRVADSRYPDTIYEVLKQKSQYGRFYWTDVVWPERASYPGNAHAVERARRIAYNLLTDAYHSKLYGAGYIFQDNRVHGKDNVWSDGVCFGR